DHELTFRGKVNSLTEVLIPAKDADMCILKATDDADILTLPSKVRSAPLDRREGKLVNVAAGTLEISEPEYDNSVTTRLAQFTRFVRDLSLFGESLRIELFRDASRTACGADAANGYIFL
ncbi:hypothetical protein OH77DRAFT_1371011, partial [Trametes cingulata]